ncbi:MAG: HAMP domain-containing protein [Chloroflexi bacterium]|nr:HAMP domain-containing protein [Chloroflexota bacterium]
MSLRLRLTLLYSALIGIILLVFGTAVFMLVYVLQVNQVDEMLRLEAMDVIAVAQLDQNGELDAITLPPLDMAANTFVQVWNRSGKLVAASTILKNINQSLDPYGQIASKPVYRDNTIRDFHVRVLSVPLKAGERTVGVLQVATSLSVADATQRDLFSAMLGSALVAVLLAAIISWVILSRALLPIEDITETVDQINRADDLSRRIPYRPQADDEIGEMVESFNQTLERLETLFTSQQRFLADVSHELRTPLTVIKGNVDLMRRMKQIDEESLTSIDQEAGRLTRLVGGLLLLAQAESGKLSLSLRPVELDVLLVEVFQEMRVLAGAKVHVHLKEIDQLQVNGDRDRLKQVLLNLAANAIQYTPQDGDVFISLAKAGDQARIIVRDTGPGIPSEDLPHIFERFYRAEKSRTRSRTSGFGLGLSIAKWIVEHHNGRIEVESKEGKGTTFAIWLPIFSKK